MSLFTFAQAPELMSYQAIVRGADDALIQNQNVGVRISVLQGSETGSAVYTETHATMTNDNGLVNLNIGAGTTSDDFSAIDWGNGTYYIKSETDPNGGTNYTIEGTSQLLSVPYALYAKNAGGGPTVIEEPNNGEQGRNVGAYSLNAAYAWDAETSNWYSTNLSGAGQAIIETNGNIGAASSNAAYAWSDADNTWYSTNLSGSFSDLKGGNGNIGAISINAAYAWNKETNSWYSTNLSGAAVAIIVTSTGNIGALSSNAAYAWNKETNTWYSTNLSGSAVSIIDSNGNIAALSVNAAYAWNSETNSWTSTNVSGSAQGIIGSTNN